MNLGKFEKQLLNGERCYERNLRDTQGPQPQAQNLAMGHLFSSIPLETFTDSV